MINNEHRKYRFLAVVLIAVFFGLGSGIVGNIISQSYITNNIFSLPFYGEVDLLNNQNRFGSGLVIKNPRKVIVEQNTKIKEVINSAEKSIVGVYLKKENVDSVEKKDILDDYYNLHQTIGEGLVLTSDGWLLVDFSPVDLKMATTSSIVNKANIDIANDYVIIDKNKDLYFVESIVPIENSEYSFFKVDAQDLFVQEFVSNKDILDGQLIIATSWKNEVDLAWVKDLKVNNDKLIKSSDIFTATIILSNEFEKDFEQSFFFDLSGGIVALYDKGELKSIDNYLIFINNLFNKEKITNVKLGINYINLVDLLLIEGKEKKGVLIYKNEKGIAIVKNSLAEKAGFLEGDIITTFDGVEIDKNNDLADILRNYRNGEQVLIEYERNGKKKSVEIEF